MRSWSFKVAAATLALAAWIVVPVAAQVEEPPMHAEVHFGTDQAGSPFPPPSGHDQSTHASHKMFPRTITIARGGTVSFEIYPLHRPAIYAPGKAVKDVVTTNRSDLSLPCLPQTLTDFVFDDPVGRVALAPPQSCEEADWESPPGTFDQPGQYLVVCTTVPHFVDDQMYGWVIVK